MQLDLFKHKDGVGLYEQISKVNKATVPTEVDTEQLKKDLEDYSKAIREAEKKHIEQYKQDKKIMELVVMFGMTWEEASEQIKLNELKYEGMKEDDYKHDHVVPIYKECPNKGKPCFCTGICREIIGYREKRK